MPKLRILKQKVLITGCNGLLGQKLVQAFAHKYDVLGLGLARASELPTANFHYQFCDITHRPVLLTIVKAFKPNFIINAAAFTDVDGSEEEKDLCWKVNVTGAENLAYASRIVNSHLIHISTDYVFDGANGPYSEDSKPNPLGFYGRSKLASENAVKSNGIDYTIVRTMVLYGTGVNTRPNFATWLIDKLAKGDRLAIVDDQFGHPTLADDLAKAILKIVELKKSGLYHIAGSEYIDRYHFALKVAEIFGFNADLIRPIKTVDLQQKAPRPLNSRFNMEKAFRDLQLEMSGVQDGLTQLKNQLERV